VHRHDPARRRRSTRAGRQKGCFIYIPAQVLQDARIDPEGPTPYYRTWPSKGGSVLVRLYRDE
jgi:hypothetical protein